MAQKYYNPNTPDSILDLTPEQLNAPVNTGDPTVTTEAQRLTKSGYVPYNSSLFSGSSSSNISQGSEDVRNEINKNKNDGSDLANEISNTQVQMTIDDLKKTLGYSDPNAELTAGEKTSIELAGAAEGQQYDPLIRQAEEARLRGLPKADIGAGERGGFMNTQFAGAAALTPTQGGDFRGVGGELKRIENEYDANIQNLQSKKLQAIQLAKAKAEEAIRTGRGEANKEARELFSLAQKANEQALDMAKKKQDLIAGATKNKADQMKYNLDIINNFSTSGQPLDDKTKADIDAIYGQGFAEKYYKTSQETDAVTKAKDIIDLLSKVPQGKQIQIGDNTYEGIKETNDTQIFSETDKSGNVTFVTIDKNTGEVIHKAEGGRIGKGQGTGTQPKPAKMTDEFKSWYYKTFNQPATESSPDVQAEWQRWQDTGRGAKEKKIDAEWGEVNPDTGKTPEQGFLDAGISQEMIDMAKSTGLLPKDLI